MTGEVNEKYLRAQSASDGEGGKRSEPTRQAEISYAVFCLKKKKTKEKTTADDLYHSKHNDTVLAYVALDRIDVLC